MSTVPQLRVTLAGSEHAGGGRARRPAMPSPPPRGAARPGGGTAAVSPSTTIAARVNGQLRDLAWPLADGDTVEAVAIGSEDGRTIMRHSAAHVMAQAVQELFPEAKLGIGPPIENGFYYDFDVSRPFTPDDLTAIERQMRHIIKAGQLFLPACGRRRRGAQGTGGRAVQAGADRAQGCGAERHCERWQRRHGHRA